MVAAGPSSVKDAPAAIARAAFCITHGLVAAVVDARNLRNRERNDLAAGTSAVCDVEIVKITPAMPGTY
jgi:hypothetical protein